MPRWLKITLKLLVCVPVSIVAGSILVRIVASGTWVIDPLVAMLPEWAAATLAGVLWFLCCATAFGMMVSEWVIEK